MLQAQGNNYIDVLSARAKQHSNQFNVLFLRKSKFSLYEIVYPPTPFSALT